MGAKQRVWLSLIGFWMLGLAACGGGGGEAPVAPSPPERLTIVTSALPDAQVGRSYSVTLRAAGGTGVGNTWRIAEGELPLGVVLRGGPECIFWNAFEQVGVVHPDDGTSERTELSGLAASRLNLGILWAHDDSGGEAILHALDTEGRLRQRYRLDAAPLDWEDIAMGPGADLDHEVIYIGDIGDNLASRDHVTILRVDEPIVPETLGATILLSHRTFTLRYPTGARDAEALVVDWATGAPYILEKNDAGGDAFQVPLPLNDGWTSTAPGMLIPTTTGRPLPATLTAADAARDGLRLLVRSYSARYELVAAPGLGLESAFLGSHCSLSVPFFGQYESLALSPTGVGLYTTTEQVLSQVPLFRALAVRDDAPARIVGTPTSVGEASVTIEVRDASGATATRTFAFGVR